MLASRTAPVVEVIEDQVNGLLVDFFDTEAIGGTVSEVLRARNKFESMRIAAMATVRERYAFRDGVRLYRGLIEGMSAATN